MTLLDNEIVDAFDAAQIIGVKSAWFNQMLTSNRYNLKNTYVRQSKQIFGKAMFLKRGIQQIADQRQHEKHVLT